MRGKNLVKGALILASASIIAKFLGFFFRIPVIYMIGEEGIGLYQLTYPLYSFLLAAAAGIPIAISKMVAERMALNKQREAFRVFKAALAMMIILGGASTAVLICFPLQIIDAFKWTKDAYYTILGISLAPFFTCILSALRGYFQGMQWMGPPAVSQIIEQIMRVFVGVGLTYILVPRGIDYAAGGASFGAVAGAVGGLVWMLYYYTKGKSPYPNGQSSAGYRKIIMEILFIAVPISIGHAVGSIMSLIDSLMVPGLLRSSGLSYQLATKLYGQMTGKAFVLISVPLTLSMALSQSTVPAISDAFAVKDYQKLKRNMKAAMKFAVILAFPCCAGLYALARPILSLVFQGMSEGWELMQILSIGAVFIIIAQICTSILNGIGKTLMPVLVLIIGCLAKVFINVVFIPLPQLNIKAAAYATLVSYLIVALLDVVLVIKYTKIRLDIMELFIGPAVCTVVMTFTVVGAYSKIFGLWYNNTAATLISIVSGGVVYILMLMITGTMGYKEIRKILKNNI